MFFFFFLIHQQKYFKNKNQSTSNIVHQLKLAKLPQVIRFSFFHNLFQKLNITKKTTLFLQKSFSNRISLFNKDILKFKRTCSSL